MLRKPVAALRWLELLVVHPARTVLPRGAPTRLEPQRVGSARVYLPPGELARAARLVQLARAVLTRLRQAMCRHFRSR